MRDGSLPPIRIIRRSPSPDPEAEFTAQPNLADHIDEFLQGIAANWRPPPQVDTETSQNTQHPGGAE